MKTVFQVTYRNRDLIYMKGNEICKKFNYRNRATVYIEYVKDRTYYDLKTVIKN